MSNAERALLFIKEGDVVGLGTGRSAATFIQALGARVRQGFNVRGIATSNASALLAKQLAIPLTTLDEVDAIDVDVDGADEVDPQLNLIKGRGGALVREKVIAAAARKFIVVVGAEKLVPTLGTRGVLPVEVIPFASTFVRRRLATLGFPSQPRPDPATGAPMLSDNHNVILDVAIQPMSNPEALERDILAIPGVVGTGLFLNMAHMVLVQDEDSVQVLERKNDEE